MGGDPRIPDGSRAILIGVPHYQDARYRSYTAVGNSVEGMYRLLVESGLCGWCEEQVEKITDPVNAGQLMGRLRQWAAETTGVLLLYFVGHGQPSEHTGELCLAIADTDHANPDATGLEYTKIKRMLHGGTPAVTKIAVLDCCYSGRAIGLGADHEGTQLADLSDCAGAYTLTAADERAHVLPDDEGDPRTAFTGELLDLLTGEGIPGGPPNLTLGAIYPRLRQRLAAKGLPRPNQRCDDAAAAFVLARNTAPRTEALLPPPPPDPPRLPPPRSNEPVPETASSRLVTTIAADRHGFIRMVAFSPDGRLLATAADTTVRLWDPGTGDPVGPSMTCHDDVSSLMFSPDGRWLAAATGTTVRLWDPATGQPVGRPLTGHSVAFSPDGRVLAVASDTEVQLWDPATGWPVGDALTGHKNSVAFSPDGRALAVVDGTEVQLWDPATGRQQGRPLTGHSSVESLAFSPNGRWLATAHMDDTVRLWSLVAPKGKRPSQRFTGHTRAVRAVAFSPDGRLLASASQDGTVRLWDVSTGRQVSIPLPGYGQVGSVAFSPDGRLLTVTGWRHEVRVFDVATARAGNTSGLNSVAFSPDGRTVAAASNTNVSLWERAAGPASPNGTATTTPSLGAEPANLTADSIEFRPRKIQSCVFAAPAAGSVLAWARGDWLSHYLGGPVLVVLLLVTLSGYSVFFAMLASSRLTLTRQGVEMKRLRTTKIPWDRIIAVRRATFQETATTVEETSKGVVGFVLDSYRDGDSYHERLERSWAPVHMPHWYLKDPQFDQKLQTIQHWHARFATPIP
jgi:WD40 repeat protein